ncbi:MAG: PhzF family phenazine biosynthesis protein [Oscillospiraceae bacterium]|jgi:PhzF family phenazine biosynthesis protein|nr:PhzF family phenazine biosynthesis protein [Oscillospiraceae bacterium]
MKYFIVDAFADELFKGNPAGVCVLDKWPDNDVLQNIAAENNLAETAFVLKRNNEYELRWFTPETEIDLCGHATLATAFILTSFFESGDKISFHTQSGLLTVAQRDELFEMDFPSRPPKKTEIDPIAQEAISAPIKEAFIARDMLLLLEKEEQIRDLKVNIEKLKVITECFAFIVTAPSSHKEYDFVSRFFAPNAGINEDPVTGSSHSTLIPFWAERLNKNKLTAKQLSKRGGTLYCENKGGRVKIAGKAKLYLEGEIKI